MGFLGRLRASRPKARSAQAVTLHAGGLLAVVGESRTQDALRRVAARATDCAPYLDDLSGRARRVAESEPGRKWFRAVLVPEPGNKYDPNAISVYADGVGRIGYLSREDALDYQPVFAALRAQGAAVCTCPAMLTGGGPGKSSYGAVLCLSDPERVLADLAE